MPLLPSLRRWRRPPLRPDRRPRLLRSLRHDPDEPTTASGQSTVGLTLPHGISPVAESVGRGRGGPWRVKRMGEAATKPVRAHAALAGRRDRPFHR
jgi:hypothetical protein